MTFDKLLEELESDFGRINFRDRIMLRRAYDVMPEKEESSDFPLRDVEFLKKCTGIIRMEVKRVRLSKSCIKIDFHNGDSWYHEYPSKQLLIKVDQLMYTW